MYYDDNTLREKCSNAEFFLVRISVCSPNAGNYGPEKTPYLVIFYVVREVGKYNGISTKRNRKN